MIISAPCIHRGIKNLRGGLEETQEATELKSRKPRLTPRSPRIKPRNPRKSPLQKPHNSLKQFCFHLLSLLTLLLITSILTLYSPIKCDRSDRKVRRCALPWCQYHSSRFNFHKFLIHSPVTNVTAIAFFLFRIIPNIQSPFLVNVLVGSYVRWKLCGRIILPQSLYALLSKSKHTVRRELICILVHCFFDTMGS